MFRTISLFFFCCCFVPFFLSCDVLSHRTLGMCGLACFLLGFARFFASLRQNLGKWFTKRVCYCCSQCSKPKRTTTTKVLYSVLSVSYFVSFVSFVSEAIFTNIASVRMVHTSRESERESLKLNCPR